MPIHNLSHLIPEVLIFGCGLIFVDNIFSLFSLILIKMISFVKTKLVSSDFLSYCYSTPCPLS